MLRREPRIAAWSTVTTPSRPDTEPSISELLPEPATPVTTTSTPSGMSTSTSCRLWVPAPRTSSAAGAAPAPRLQRGAVVEVPPGQRVAGPQPLDGALEHHLPALAPARGPEVDDVVGDRDRLRLVLDDQHGVALVAQLQQQVVHPLDVVRVQPDRRLVEDVGDVGQRRAELADHLGPLRLAARERARGPIEREVAEPDLHERVEGLPQHLEQRRHRRLVEAAHPLGQVADLHRAGVGDALLLDLRRAGRLAEPGAVALGTGGEGDRPVHEGPDVRLHRLRGPWRGTTSGSSGSGPRR